MKANQHIASPSDGSANHPMSPIHTRAKRSLMPLLLGASLVAASGCALAQPGGDRPGRGGPPPEALTACDRLTILGEPVRAWRKRNSSITTSAN